MLEVPASNSKMLVEFYDGPVIENQLLDAVQMTIAPRVGEVVVFELNGDRTRLIIESVEHIFSVRRIDEGLGKTIESRHERMCCATQRNAA